MDSIRGQDSSSFSSGQPFQRKLKQQNAPFLDSWAEKSAIWGTRHGLGESLDRYFGLHTPSFSFALSDAFEGLGIDDFEGKENGPLSYDRILKLKNSHVKWHDLSLKSLKETVSKNTYEFCQATQANQARPFFAGVSLKTYAKETLWKGNIKPVQELLNGSTDNLFKNLFYMTGIGLVGASIIKTGLHHYRYWREQEDGSITNQWRTAYRTGKAICQKVIQSLGSWEAAGVGMAIGQALIPIGAFPIGGILIGALFATTAYKAIGQLFPTLAKPGLSEN